MGTDREQGASDPPCALLKIGVEFTNGDEPGVKLESPIGREGEERGAGMNSLYLAALAALAAPSLTHAASPLPPDLQQSGFPYIDVERNCQIGMTESRIRKCREDQQNSYEKARAIWPRLSNEAKAYCAARFSAHSYTYFLTCLIRMDTQPTLSPSTQGVDQRSD